MKYRLVVVLLTLFPLPLLAQAFTADELVQELSTCDSAFFLAIKKNATNLQKISTVTVKEKVAYLAVGDRATDDKNVTMFAKPIEGKVRLLGYFDEIVDLGSMGKYYSWGFLASGTPNSVVTAIKPLVSDGVRLRKDGDVFVRSELRDVTAANGKWVSNDNLTSGTIPKNNTAERVFLIEPAGDKYPAVVRIGCSLQGAVSAGLLASERPDIE